MSGEIHLPLAIDEIDIGGRRREINQAAVKRLADSINEVGLRHPITVRQKGEKYILVAGAHRIEAHKRLGRDYVPACIVKMSNDEARLWELAENLHRAELSKLERDDSIAEWIKITERVNASQVAAHRKPGQQPGGVNAASRELGIDPTDAHRAVRVASLSDEAKEAARETGLDNNRSALLEAARETEPKAQVAKLSEYRASRVDGDVKQRAAKEVASIIAEYVPGDAWDAIKANLYAAGAANIANELTNITGQSIMDGRFK
jgi:ParB-like chromosome segregation protein Spo0J